MGRCNWWHWEIWALTEVWRPEINSVLSLLLLCTGRAPCTRSGFSRSWEMLSLQTTDSVTASPSPSELSPLHTQSDSPFPAGCPVPLLAAGNSILSWSHLLQCWKGQSLAGLDQHPTQGFRFWCGEAALRHRQGALAGRDGVSPGRAGVQELFGKA